MSAMTINDERIVARLRLGAMVHGMAPAQYLSALLADDLDFLQESSQRIIAEAFSELPGATQ